MNERNTFVSKGQLQERGDNTDACIWRIFSCCSKNNRRASGSSATASASGILDVLCTFLQKIYASDAFLCLREAKRISLLRAGTLLTFNCTCDPSIFGRSLLLWKIFDQDDSTGQTLIFKVFKTFGHTRPHLFFMYDSGDVHTTFITISSSALCFIFSCKHSTIRSLILMATSTSE